MLPPSIEDFDLRDYFAAEALREIIAGLYRRSVPLNAETIAQDAYTLADAMMEARGTPTYNAQSNVTPKKKESNDR